MSFEMADVEEINLEEKISTGDQDDNLPIITFFGDLNEATKEDKSLDKDIVSYRDWCNSNQNNNNVVESDKEENFQEYSFGRLTNSEDKGGGEDMQNSDSNDDEFKVTIEDTSEDTSEPDDNVENYCNAQPVPTLEELANSDYLHNRQLAARKILEFLQQASYDEKELQSVISVMCKLSEDEETMVQYELVQNIPAIASYCQHQSHLRIIIRQQLMPYTVKLLNDVQVLIRKSGQSALLILLEENLIDQSQLYEWICPLVNQLVMCESNLEELRVEDVSLMCKMIPMVGCEITLKFFLDPFIALCCDPVSSVRKVCASGFGAFCKVVGKEVTEISLLPSFINLCNDEVWQARKFCAEVFVDVANSVSTKTRKEILYHIFVNLLTDNHTSVKHSAYLCLGKFISTFADPTLTGCSYKNGEIIIDSTKVLETDACCEVPVLSTEEMSKGKKLCAIDLDLTGNHKRVRSNVSHENFRFNSCEVLYPKSDSSLAVAAKDGHVYLHVGNEQLFNNFQFWRIPLPEVELDIDIEEGKATNIHVRATTQGNESLSASSDITVRIESKNASDYELSSFEKTSEVVNKMLVRTACINTLSKEQHLIHDVEVLRSAFKEAVLVFKSDEPEINIESTTAAATSPNSEHGYVFQSVPEVKHIKMTPYDQDIVPPILLASYISIVDNYKVNRTVSEDDKLGFIAYSFPAVAFTLGRQYWPCIRNTCERLARNMKWTVRRTIASSLHELATILGYDIIITDLLPIFLDLFKDVDEVRLRLVQHLSDFLKHLKPEDRKQFLPLIDQFTEMDNEKNWRFRSAVAEELIKVVTLYDTTEIPVYFLSIASNLLHDKVAAVRLAAVELMAVLLKNLHEDPRTNNYFETMLKGIDDLYRQATKWVWRQIYIKLCEEFIMTHTLSVEEFVNKIVPNLLSLAFDEVPNVRLTLTNSLLNMFFASEDLFNTIIASPTLQQLLLKTFNSLKCDVDQDVRYFAHKFQWSPEYLEL